MEKINEKIIHLDNYLFSKYHLYLEDILKDNKDELVKIKNNEDIQINDKLIESISNIFFLDINTLKDDNQELPHDEHLKVDELKIKIAQGDYVNEIERKKNKNLIKKNYSLLSKKMKKKLVINLSLLMLPFALILGYAFTSNVINVNETLNTYKEGDTLSKAQKEIEDNLLKEDKENPNLHVDTKVSVVLESINNISSSNSSYNATLVTNFDFDQIDFFKMYYENSKGIEFNKDNFYTNEDFLSDNYCFDSEGTGYLEYKDNIPDILQFNFDELTHMSKDNKPTSVSTLYLEMIKAYPGEKSSNVFSDKNDEFRIGNGKITPDSLEYQNKGTAYFDKVSSSYRYSQKLHFDCVINKTFDSPRYPLDSAQFKIYIQPTRSSDYIRYIANSESSGFSTYFNITNGYRLIKETSEIKNFNIKLNYYKELDVDTSSSTYNEEIIKTQIEVIVRANKQGFMSYINSFLNIIAVASWLILAFYNQSFNRDDSMGMIGTGFFSAISAILLGLSTVGFANTYSLLTYVNVFTLLMVLIMGFEIIKNRRYTKLQNASLLAYSECKIRILFYFLVIASIFIYILIPGISYIWLL